MSGIPPFRGPTMPDYEKQHLFSPAPVVEKANPLIRSLISMLLRKNPEARPSTERVRAILENVISTSAPNRPSSGLQAIALAGAKEVESISAEEARKIATQAIREKRDNLGIDAFGVMAEMRKNLFEKIKDFAQVVAPH